MTQFTGMNNIHCLKLKMWSKCADNSKVIQCYILSCKRDNCDNIVQTLNFLKPSNAGYIVYTDFDC